MESSVAAWCKIDFLYVNAHRGNDTHGALCKSCATHDPLSDITDPLLVIRHSVVLHRHPIPRRCDICRRELTILRKFHFCTKCREYSTHFLTESDPDKLREIFDLDDTVSIPIRQIRVPADEDDDYIIDISN